MLNEYQQNLIDRLTDKGYKIVLVAPPTTEPMLESQSHEMPWRTKPQTITRFEAMVVGSDRDSTTRVANQYTLDRELIDESQIAGFESHCRYRAITELFSLVFERLFPRDFLKGTRI